MKHTATEYIGSNSFLRWQVRETRTREASYPLYADKSDSAPIVAWGTAEQYAEQYKQHRGKTQNIAPILKEHLQEYVAKQVKETVLLGYGYTKEDAETMANVQKWA